MASKVRTLTLNSYLDKYGDNSVASLYVVNRSNPKGNIAFNCVDEMNRPIGVFVPATFIPVDLTELIQRDGLIKNTAFKRLLSSGRLVIVDNESVEEYFLNNKTAQAELARIQGLEASSMQELSAVVDGQEIDLMGSNTRQKVMIESDDETQDEMFTRIFLERCGMEEEEDMSLINEFLQRGTELPEENLRYLAENIKRSAVREIVLEALA